MLQDIIEQCKAKAQIAFNKLQSQAASVAAEAKAVVKNLLPSAAAGRKGVYLRPPRAVEFMGKGQSKSGSSCCCSQN